MLKEAEDYGWSTCGTLLYLNLRASNLWQNYSANNTIQFNGSVKKLINKLNVSMRENVSFLSFSKELVFSFHFASSLGHTHRWRESPSWGFSVWWDGLLSFGAWRGGFGELSIGMEGSIERLWKHLNPWAPSPHSVRPNSSRPGNFHPIYRDCVIIYNYVLCGCFLTKATWKSAHVV